MKQCEWFLLCTNTATGTTFHPILGDVPTCDRCNSLANLNNCEKEDTDEAG